jgi:hypothetical protein
MELSTDSNNKSNNFLYSAHFVHVMNLNERQRNHSIS